MHTHLNWQGTGPGPSFDSRLWAMRLALVIDVHSDRPLTDLYDTEGQGDYSPTRFMARPVVGGHFARLALEQACNGKATQALEFLETGDEVRIDAKGALQADAATGHHVYPAMDL